MGETEASEAKTFSPLELPASSVTAGAQEPEAQAALQSSMEAEASLEAPLMAEEAAEAVAANACSERPAMGEMAGRDSVLTPLPV